VALRFNATVRYKLNARLSDCLTLHIGLFNLLNTKRNLLYISNQSVPRSKHFPPRL
jgi:hypothetical protein